MGSSTAYGSQRKFINSTTFPISVDNATGVASGKILDRELLEQFEAVSQLAVEDRAAVKKLLEGLIVKHQVEQVMKPKREQSWTQRFRAITEKLAQGTKGMKQPQIDGIIDEAMTAVRDTRHARS
jgi:hypothetical protein